MTVPLLHIQVEGIQHSMIQALTEHHEEFTRIAQEEIDALDIDSIIRFRIRTQAPRMVQDAIDVAVEKAVREAVGEARFNDRMGEIVRAAIAGALEGASR